MKRLYLLLPILFLWFPNVSHAAIAYDNSSTGYSNTGNVSWTQTVSGTNRLLIIGCQEHAGQTISSITVNGSATGVTLIDHLSTGGTTFPDVYNYYLVAPPTGTVTIAVNVSASTYNYCGAVSYTGVNQTTPTDVHGTNALTGVTSITSSLTTTVANDWLSAFVRVDSYSPTAISAGSGTTLRQQGPTGTTNVWYAIADSNGALATGSNSLVITRPASGGLSTNMVAIEPYVAPTAHIYDIITSWVTWFY